MAATIEEIREKLNRYSDSNSKMPHINSPYQNSHFCNFSPFSTKKTKNTLDDIFYKLLRNYKTVHNRKYTQAFFPYYVFMDSIFDLDGKIVLIIHKELIGGNNYSRRYVLEVTRDFYDKYTPQIQNYLNLIGNTNSNPDFRPRVVIHNTDDIFFVYNKEYTFSNFSQRKQFKEVLLEKINNKFIYKKEVHLQGLPF